MPSQDESMLRRNAAAHALITKDHVAAALASDKGSAATFESFEIKDFLIRGDNYTSFVTSVVVRYKLPPVNSTEEVTYIVKANLGSNSLASESFNNVVFEKESGFYSELLPKLNEILHELGQPKLKLPCCYHSFREMKKEVIFLEDMRSKGFKLNDRTKALSEVHVRLILEELARLHAVSKLYAMKENTQNLLIKHKLLEELISNNKMPEDVKIFEKMFTDTVNNGAMIASKIKGYEKLGEYLTKLSPTALEIMNNECLPTEPQFTVVNHGDCWNNNLLFRFNEDGAPVEVCLIDMQVCRWSSLALDLNYLLYSSVDGDTRKRCLDNFMSCYYNKFSNIFEKKGQTVPFTIEDIKNEYVRKCRFGLISSLMLVPCMLLETRQIPNIDEVTKENTDTMVQEYLKTVQEEIETSPLLKLRLTALFDDMIENGIVM